MRKPKLPHFTAKKVMYTMPPSFALWIGHHGSARWTQMKAAQEILGIDFETFCEMYPAAGPDVRAARDPLWQEYVRCARWLIEGKIMAWYAAPGKKLRLQVQWASATVWVEADLLAPYDGFLKVCYDRVLPDALEDHEGASTEGQEALFSPRLTTPTGTRIKILGRWLDLSGWIFEDGLSRRAPEEVPADRFFTLARGV